MIAIDIETYDPSLKDLGDGSIRNDGCVLCVGLYDGHDSICVTPDDPRLKDWLESDEPKIFHNGVYDLSWLDCNLHFKVNGTIHDTMTRAAMIDEYAELGLQACCERHKVAGKDKGSLEQWAKDNGIKNMMGNLILYWQDVNGRDAIMRYCIQDCIATYNLFQAQEAAIAPQLDAYKLECDIYPIVLEMKRNGIRVDTGARDAYAQQIQQQLDSDTKALEMMYGINQEIIRSPKKLGIAMHALGLSSPIRTKTDAESWSADALSLIDHPVTDLIQSIKTNDATMTKYLTSALTEGLINDRIHCTFSPNKRELGGTVTGRFASSKPNMQNIPAREEKHGQEMRQLFIPEDGCMIGAFDYSQIEYLLLAHYATGPQAAWFQSQARAGVDFHTVAMEATHITSRSAVKKMNYGIIYGMGASKMLQSNRRLFTALAEEEHMDPLVYTQNVFKQYHERLPVIKDTMFAIQNEAKVAGYVKSIGGRIHHKPRPQFIDGKMNDFIYKMTNYKVQGSASEILKRGMVDSWKAGVFDILRLHVTVHDENVVSIPYNPIGTEAAVHMQQCMEAAYKDVLLVPMKVVGEVGPNWGYWSDDIYHDMRRGIYDKQC